MATLTQHQRYVYNNDPLTRLGNILTIIPPHHYITKDETGRKRYWYKWYAFVIFFMIICGDAHSLWGRSRDSYPYLKSSTLLVTDIGVNLSTVVTNMLTVLMPTFCHMDVFFLFKDIFLLVDNYLGNGNSKKTKNCTLFYSELVLGHLIFLAILSYDAYVWITGLGMTLYRNYIFRYFQNYHLFITVMIMYNSASLMYCKLKQTNSKLKEMLSPAVVGYSIPESHAQPEKFNFHKNVRKISQIYEKQILQIHLYNKIFGWQILILTLSIMMTLIEAVDTITVYIFVENGIERNTFGMDLIILGCLCTLALWQFLLGILVTASCNAAWQEAQQTGDICFSILLKLPIIIPKSSRQKSLQDELTLLAQMVSQRCPMFSAAGFFIIDYRVVLAIFGSVTSYVIVLIQFNK